MLAEGSPPGSEAVRNGFQGLERESEAVESARRGVAKGFGSDAKWILEAEKEFGSGAGPAARGCRELPERCEVFFGVGELFPEAIEKEELNC